MDVVGSSPSSPILKKAANRFGLRLFLLRLEMSTISKAKIMTKIRSMSREELDQLVSWAQAEGWEPGFHDAKYYWELDPEGYLAIEEDDRFVGGGAIIRHSESFGFMGLFIVNQPHRGKGLGTKLWQTRRDTLLARMNEGATIGLDGVYEMVPFYEKGGFKQFTYHRRFRLDAPFPDVQCSEAICDLKEINFESVKRYDRQCFPASRDSFLQDWIHQPSAIPLGYTKDDELAGFGVMRPCDSGWRIGPLFADSLDVADALFQAFQLEQQGKPIFIDIPDNNPQGQQLRQRYELEEVFGCVRMYYGPPPSIDYDRIFGVTSFEVG